MIICVNYLIAIENKKWNDMNQWIFIDCYVELDQSKVSCKFRRAAKQI